MRFYIQSGTFEASDDLSTFWQIFGFAITIIAAYGGAAFTIRMQKQKEEKDRQKELAERYLFILSLSKRASNVIKSQLDYIEMYCEKLKTKPTQCFDYGRASLDDVKRLLLLLTEERTFQAYMKAKIHNEKRHDEYNSIIFFLDYFNNGLNSIIENIVSTSSEIHIKRKEFSDCFENFKDKTFEIIKIGHISSDPICLEMHKILSIQRSNTDLEDLQYVNLNIVNPLINNLKKVKSVNDKLIDESLKYGFDCIKIINEIMGLNISYSVSFMIRHSEFIKHYNSLDTLLEH